MASTYSPLQESSDWPADSCSPSSSAPQLVELGTVVGGLGLEVGFGSAGFFGAFVGDLVGLVGVGDCLAGDEGEADCAGTGFEELEEPDEPLLTGDKLGAGVAGS
jgi:hypothetical protein